MSARGSFVTSPGSKSAKLISESKRYIPLLWFGFLAADDCAEEQAGQFELDRKVAILRAEANLPFLTELFSDIRAFKECSNAFLERLKALRSKTIGIDIAELILNTPQGMADLQTALGLIESRDAEFKLSMPSQTVVNPATGDKVKIKARKIASTCELLLEIAWLKPGESPLIPSDIKRLKANDAQEIITGYVYE